MTKGFYNLTSGILSQSRRLGKWSCEASCDNCANQYGGYKHGS